MNKDNNKLVLVKEFNKTALITIHNKDNNLYRLKLALEHYGRGYLFVDNGNLYFSPTIPNLQLLIKENVGVMDRININNINTIEITNNTSLLINHLYLIAVDGSKIQVVRNSD